MDGGAIAFDATGKVETAWRREKAVFASGLSAPEQQLAASAVQPVIVASDKQVYRFWESNGALVFQQGGVPSAQFAEKASFAAAAAFPSGGAVVVWESRIGGNDALLAGIVRVAP
jgi:hypothetical protein